jgi:hypothetical protein
LQLLGTALLPAHAATGSAASDNSLILISSAMVLLMTPGLAFFYGGFAQGRNVLNTMGMSIVMMGIATLTWAGVGFSLAFGDGGSWNAVIGNPFDHALLENLSGTWDGLTIPGLSFALFQGMFAIITPALISGALVERLSFRFLCLFTPIWLLVVTPLWPTWFGEGVSLAKIWTSPVALWCTSVLACLPSSWLDWLDAVRVGRSRADLPTTSPKSFWVLACSGLAGLALTVEVSCRLLALNCPSPPHIFQRLQVW